MWGKTRRSENGRECRQPALSSWLLWLSNTWDTPQLNEVLDPKNDFHWVWFFRMRKYNNRILCLALHNVLFAQYVFLPTEQAETYSKIYVLIYHLTYICPSLCGWKEKWFLRKTRFSNVKFAISGSFWPILSLPKIIFLEPQNKRRDKF